MTTKLILSPSLNISLLLTIIIIMCTIVHAVATDQATFSVLSKQRLSVWPTGLSQFIKHQRPIWG